MKSYRFSMSRLAFLAFTCWLLNVVAAPVQAEEVKLVAQLIWGTNDEKSPDPSHKPVEEKVAIKLKKLPLKWQHYFEVSCKRFDAKLNETQKIELSKECKIEVRYTGKDSVEVKLYGKGELVGKISQSLPKGELLVTGGNAENLTAWFVVLRRSDRTE